MNFVDLIEKKKQGGTHSREEINFFIDSYMAGSISDAQAGAWLTAVCFNGLTLEETVYLTESMGNSGKKINFGSLNSSILDKHSTGGVGDKVTLTLMPLLAAAGIPTVKLAERSIGFTAGTIDKLESIPNFSTELSSVDIVNQVKSINAVIAYQSNDLATADKKIFKLRDEVGALNSAPLIASSVLSKKIASGATNIIIDVKYGSGTFMKTQEDAFNLSKLIVGTAKLLGKSVTTVITSMEEPLGRAVGNTLEVIEAIEFLKGNCDESDLAQLTYSMASVVLLQMDLYANHEEAEEYLKKLVHSGKAIEKLHEIIYAQGGETEIIENYDKFVLPAFKVECESKKSGYIQTINAYNISKAAEALGAARIHNEKPIDLSVGIYLNKKSGEYVNKGETLYTIYSNDEETSKIAQRYCDDAFSVNENKPNVSSLIYKIISTKDEDDHV